MVAPEVETLEEETDEMTGGVTSPLLTVTLTPADTVELPAASRATAVSVCGPLTAAVVVQRIEYGGPGTSVPSAASSSLNCTPTTPTLSGALAETATTAVTACPARGAVIDTAGTTVSSVVKVKSPETASLLAASLDRT